MIDINKILVAEKNKIKMEYSIFKRVKNIEIANLKDEANKARSLLLEIQNEMNETEQTPTGSLAASFFNKNVAERGVQTTNVVNDLDLQVVDIEFLSQPSVTNPNIDILENLNEKLEQNKIEIDEQKSEIDKFLKESEI